MSELLHLELQLVKSPKGLKIEPRRMNMEFAEDLPTYWHSDDAFISHFFNSLSCTFPTGEQFFIDSVRHFRPYIGDPELREQIRGFIGQEGFHSHEHRQYNQWLKGKGYDIERLEKIYEGRIALGNKYNSKLMQLAMTAGLEHLTAIMADNILRNPKLIDDAHPVMQKIWRWHAVEEAEHKAVAFDVYQKMGGGYWMRVYAFFMISIFLPIDVMTGMFHMLKKDGKLFSAKGWWSGIKFLWGKQGFVRRIIPAYFSYLKPGFHPWQHNNLELIEGWLEEYQQA